MFTLYIVNSRTVRACTAQKTGAFDTQLSQLSNALHSEPPLNDHWYSCPPTARALATRKGAYANASSGKLKSSSVTVVLRDEYPPNARTCPRIMPARCGNYPPPRAPRPAATAVPREAAKSSQRALALRSGAELSSGAWPTPGHVQHRYSAPSPMPRTRRPRDIGANPPPI